MGTVADLDIENTPAEVQKESGAAKAVGLKFLANSMEFKATPTDQQVDAILATLQGPPNQPIYLHCHHGEDRTGLIFGLYRVRLQGWTPEKAY